MEYYFLTFIDPSFYAFLGFVAALLGVLGMLLCVLKKIPKTNAMANKIWVAYRSWFFIAPLCFFCVGMGGQILVAAFFVLSVFSIKEFAKATQLTSHREWMSALYLGATLIYLATAFNASLIFMLLPTALVILLLAVPLLLDTYEGMLPKFGLSLIAILYIGWFPAHLALLAHHPAGYAYLLFFLIGTEFHDASAYLCGKFFGKHRLIPNISPGKTIEGSMGAFVIICGYVWLMHTWVPGFNLLLSVLSVLLLTVGGTMGDLAMSFFKRAMGIKDMGTLIPGHGGLLDRVDSMILIAPFCTYFVLYLVPLLGEVT